MVSNDMRFFSIWPSVFLAFFFSISLWQNVNFLSRFLRLSSLKSSLSSSSLRSFHFCNWSPLSKRSIVKLSPISISLSKSRKAVSLNESAGVSSFLGAFNEFLWSSASSFSRSFLNSLKSVGFLLISILMILVKYKYYLIFDKLREYILLLILFHFMFD